MPTYYFDIYDDGALSPDEFGVELDDLHEARDQAIALLPDLARDALPGGDRHTFKIVVKCHDLQARYVTTLTLDGGWVELPPGDDPDPPPSAHRLPAVRRHGGLDDGPSPVIAILD